MNAQPLTATTLRFFLPFSSAPSSGVLHRPHPSPPPLTPAMHPDVRHTFSPVRSYMRRMKQLTAQKKAAAEAAAAEE